MTKKYRVTITEALKRTVDVTAESKEAAEQIVGDEWYSERTETNGRIKKGLLRGHV